MVNAAIRNNDSVYAMGRCFFAYDMKRSGGINYSLRNLLPRVAPPTKLPACVVALREVGNKEMTALLATNGNHRALSWHFLNLVEINHIFHLFETSL